MSVPADAPPQATNTGRPALVPHLPPPPPGLEDVGLPPPKKKADAQNANDDDGERVRRAQVMLEDAEAAEREGRAQDAVRLYQKAYKLAPCLDPCRADAAETIAAIAATNGGEAFELDYVRTPPADSGFRTFPAATLDDPDGRAAVRSFLAEQGYVVLTDALSEADVAHAHECFRGYMLSAAGMDVTDASEFVRFADPALGIVGKRGAGHSSMNWFVRSRARVKQAFRVALACDGDEKTATAFAGGGPGGEGDVNGSAATPTPAKLITSFDGFNYFRNPEADPAWQGGITPWFHVDAGCRETCGYVQGVVSLTDAPDANDAGLVLLPRSHRTLFDHLVPAKQLSPEYRNYFTPLPPSVERRIPALIPDARDRVAFRVPMPAGSIVLWRSDVLHCNTSALPREGAAACPTQLLRRLVSYVSMMRDPCDPELTARRRVIFAAGRTCCHQPDLSRSVGDHAPEEAVAAGDVIVDEAKLPDGAAELL